MLKLQTIREAKFVCFKKIQGGKKHDITLRIRYKNVWEKGKLTLHKWDHPEQLLSFRIQEERDDEQTWVRYDHGCQVHAAKGKHPSKYTYTSVRLQFLNEYYLEPIQFTLDIDGVVYARTNVKIIVLENKRERKAPKRTPGSEEAFVTPHTARIETPNLDDLATAAIFQSTIQPPHSNYQSVRPMQMHRDLATAAIFQSTMQPPHSNYQSVRPMQMHHDLTTTTTIFQSTMQPPHSNYQSVRPMQMHLPTTEVRESVNVRPITRRKRKSKVNDDDDSKRLRGDLWI